MTAHQDPAPAGAIRRGVVQVTDHLRPYQKRDYRDVLARCERVRSVLYVAFMGSGKTVLAAAVIRTWVARGDRVLIVTHTREILRQTHDKLLAAGIAEDQIGWIWREHPRTNPEAQIQLASLDTLIQRVLPKGITRVVIDEAHHATAKKWRDVIDAYPEARVLGLTGTPVRLDGQPLGAVFEEMIESEPVESLIEGGWIARPSYWTPTWSVELPRRSGNDFGDLVAAGMLPHAKVLESMVAEYTKHAAGLPALGFAATCEKAIQYAAHFAASGIAADTLFGSDTDLKRQGTLARLRRGTLRVLWTCNVLGEGWDYPGLRCVMLARPTLSIARYLQQVARCMRPGTPPVILDLWGAWGVHDPPWAGFGWSLQTKPRTSLHVGGRNTTGEVTWLPPVEVEGELVRADASMRVSCSVCENPATRASAFNSKYRGNKPYCADHARGRGLYQILSCSVCGTPATRTSSYNAHRKGTQPYCAEHSGGNRVERAAALGSARAKQPLPCTICGEPATRSSSSGARCKGTKPYCAEHVAGNRAKRREPDPTAPKGPLPCAVCGGPATVSSSATSRRIGSKPYCAEHVGGLKPEKPLCAICGEPATRSSVSGARSRGVDVAYCAKHVGGRSAKKSALPCATCGKPATRGSTGTARHLGTKPYCAEHIGGPSARKPLLLCAVCGNPATRTSSNTARLVGIKAYCAEHTGGPNRKRPRLPCVVCGNPASSASSLNAPFGAKPYCSRHTSNALDEEKTP